MPRTESPAVLSEFAVRSHKEKACFPFRVSLKSVGPLSGASTQTAVMEQMPAEWEPCQAQRPQTVSPFFLLLVSEGPAAARPLRRHLSVADVRSSPRGSRWSGATVNLLFFSLCDRLNSWIHSHIFQQRRAGGPGLLWPDFIA